MSMSDASNVASLGNMALGGPGLGPAGIGLGFASSMLGGKGGGKNVTLGGGPGNYTVDGKKFEGVNDYQIQGNNGMYNLLPALGQNQNREGLEASMQNDPLALELFNKRFPKEQPSTQLQNFQSGNNFGRMAPITGKPATQYQPNLNLFKNNPTINRGGPMGYNMGQFVANQFPKAFSTYARDQKNPFFTPK